MISWFVTLNIFEFSSTDERGLSLVTYNHYNDQLNGFRIDSDTSNLTLHSRSVR